ncbi:MAG: c-type cytochrome [Planctomycetaceae bacterium]
MRAAFTRYLSDGFREALRRNPEQGAGPIDSGGSLLLELANDPAPEVRAQVVVAAIFLKGPFAAELIFAAMQTEQDPQLTYVINEARGIVNLDAAIRDNLARGEKLSRNAEAYALSNASVEDLLKMEKTEGVYRAILTRENAAVETLQTALTGLAKLRHVAEIEELFTLIEELNAKASVNVLNSLSRLLANQPADQLAKVRDRIATLATTAKSGETRRVAIAAWISADNNGDGVFTAVEKKQLKLEDVLRSVELVSSVDAKRSLMGPIVAIIPKLEGSIATYFDNGGGDGLTMSWSGPGVQKEQIPASVLVSAAEQTIQDLGIQAMMNIPGHETAKTEILASLLKKRESVNSSLQSLVTIPVEMWPKEQLGNLAEAAVSYIASREPRDRNSEQARLALTIANGVRSRLDATGKTRFEKRLAEVVVPLITLGTVPERMIYDRETVAVQAGRPVEFRLTNSDNMPHNFAVVLPGTMAEVGEQAEATGRDADAAARNFIPKSDKILVASKLVQPGQTDSIFFEVPQEPGIYPYVCTYPGHWRRMYGALYVVADLTAYEADSAGYLADHPLEMRDDLLKYLGRNTDWQLDDLKGDVMHLSHRANNFAVGQQLFKAAACVGCHKLGGQGNNIGPDLSKLPSEYSKLDVLDHILNPSKKIDRKYQSNVIELTSGKVLTGLIVEEGDTELKLIDNRRP